MAKYVNFSVLDQMHRIQQGLISGELNEATVRTALEAIIAKMSPGQSSLNDEIVAVFEGVKLTEADFQEVIVHKGQQLKRHRNGGGWVPVTQHVSDTSKCYVAASAYVGPSARVYGDARVIENTSISGNAEVFGSARVSDDARVFGNARVCGGARVDGTTSVSGDNWIDGSIVIRSTSSVGVHSTGRHARKS